MTSTHLLAFASLPPQAARSPTEMIIEKIAAVYTPVVVVSALLLATLPWMHSVEAGRANLYRACVLLVVACPCALVISTPVTYVSALAHCAQEGILVKGGQ